MVSLNGYPIDFYATSIIASYVGLGVLLIIRFLVEREKIPMWRFQQGKWFPSKRWKYMYIGVIVALLAVLIIYRLDVRIGFVMFVNGVVASLIVTESVKLVKAW